MSYTLSKSIDDAGNFFFSTVQNNFNIRDDRGLSDNDQRHRLVVSGLFSAPEKSFDTLRGFEIGYIFTYASRLPFNVLLGNDRNFDTTNNDRPLGVGRNTGSGDSYSSVDLAFARQFRSSQRTLEVRAEAFNLFSTLNYYGFVGALSSPYFAQGVKAGPTRRIQLAAIARF